MGSEWTNNLDPDQASTVVFPDTMYTCRDTQGGSKLITFFYGLLLSQHPVDPNIACADSVGEGGTRGPDSLEKQKLFGFLYGISRGVEIVKFSTCPGISKWQ